MIMSFFSIRNEVQVTNKEGAFHLELTNRILLHEGIGDILGVRGRAYGTAYFLKIFISCLDLLQEAESFFSLLFFLVFP